MGYSSEKQRVIKNLIWPNLQNDNFVDLKVGYWIIYSKFNNFKKSFLKSIHQELLSRTDIWKKEDYYDGKLLITYYENISDPNRPCIQVYKPIYERHKDFFDNLMYERFNQKVGDLIFNYTENMFKPYGNVLLTHVDDKNNLLKLWVHQNFNVSIDILRKIKPYRLADEEIIPDTKLLIFKRENIDWTIINHFYETEFL